MSIEKLGLRKAVNPQTGEVRLVNVESGEIYRLSPASEDGGERYVKSSEKALTGPEWVQPVKPKGDKSYERSQDPENQNTF